MIKLRMALTAAVFGVGAAFVSAPAAVAAPLDIAKQIVSGGATSEFTQKRGIRRGFAGRGNRGFRRGYVNRRAYGRPYGYRRRGGAAVGAGIAGLAAGAILGGALAAQAAPQASYGGGSSWIAYCSQKYRSFDPASGTYLGYDGKRHACQ